MTDQPTLAGELREIAGFLRSTYTEEAAVIDAAADRLDEWEATCSRAPDVCVGIRGVEA